MFWGKPGRSIAALVAGSAVFVLLLTLYAAIHLWSSSFNPVGYNTKRLGSTDVVVRFDGAVRLGEMGQEANEAIPALTRLLADEDGSVRFSAAEALLKIDKDNVDAFNWIIDALTHDKDPVARLSAASYLGRCQRSQTQSETIVPALIRALLDDDDDVRIEATQSLGLLGPLAKSAVGPLSKLLRDRNWQIRVHAAQALGDIGPDAVEAVPSMVYALGSDGNAKVRLACAYSLGQIGPGALDALPVLTSALNDVDPDMRLIASQAIGQIRGNPMRAPR
jgi:HEAT repeat protein